MPPGVGGPAGAPTHLTSLEVADVAPPLHSPGLTVPVSLPHSEWINNKGHLAALAPPFVTVCPRLAVISPKSSSQPKLQASQPGVPDAAQPAVGTTAMPVSAKTPVIVGTKTNRGAPLFLFIFEASAWLPVFQQVTPFLHSFQTTLGEGNLLVDELWPRKVSVYSTSPGSFLSSHQPTQDLPAHPCAHLSQVLLVLRSKLHSVTQLDSTVEKLLQMPS